MLLSYKKPVTASSAAENSSPELAVNEDCRSWWSAAGTEPGEWLCVDLGKESDVRAIQVNMADEKLVVDFPADSYGDDRKTRHIETRPQISHYTVETSVNGADWTTRETVARECSNGYYEYADGIRAGTSGSPAANCPMDSCCASAVCGCSATARAQSPHRPKPPGLA